MKTDLQVVRGSSDNSSSWQKR